MNLEMIDPKKHHQLFVDDFVIESSSGTSRSLHSPKKWGPLIKGGIQSRSTPQWNSEKKLWEWWYFGEGTRYAVSEDGENWELPSLGLFEMNGSRDNNVAFDPNASGATGFWGELFSTLSLSRHYESITRGVLDSKDIIYFLSIVVLGLALSEFSISKRF